MLGSFAVVQALRTRGRAGEDEDLFRIRWVILVGFFVGALILGGVIGAFNLRVPVALTVLIIYVGVGVAVVVLSGLRRHLE